jgi:signal transduction histidine kinase
MASSPRLTLISPLRVWLIFNALFVVLAASSTYSSYRLAAADEQRLVASQVLTLTKSRVADLQNRRFRDFVEGVGREFTGLYIRVDFADQVLESGVRPEGGHCAELDEPLGAGGAARVTMCRPFTLTFKPLVLVLLAYLLISAVALSYVRRLERRTTGALVGFLKDSGVEVDSSRGLVGIMADVRDIRARLDRAKEQERQLALARARAELAEQVAHDIRSPLAVLQDLGRDSSAIPADIRGLFIGALDRVIAISEDILRRGRAERAPETASLAAAVKAVVEEKRVEHRGRAVVLTFETTAGAPETPVAAPAAELQRVLSNLLNNAVEAGASSVSVRLDSDGDTLRLSVVDDGKGIAPGVLPGLGTRGDSRGKAGGSGLGLSHARERAQAWGGRLEVDSVLGQGTRATLVLPARRPPATDAAPAGPAYLIDDDPLVRKNWEVAAAKAGCSLRTFASARAFREACADFPRIARVYIDDRLGGSERGIEESRAIHALGFHDIFLETGDAPGSAELPSHLRGAVGKTPPWGLDA